MYAKYSGGTGEPNNPYQIATAADLIALGETPGDYDKHFILTADIDLDPNLPGRKVFDRAVIAPDTDPNDPYSGFQGAVFTGVFDGNDHAISHLTIKGAGYLGLFGQLKLGAEVRNLGLVQVKVVGSGVFIGGVVGANGVPCVEPGGIVTACYSTGVVDGGTHVGGLVASNVGTITRCHSDCVVNAPSNVGGLVGGNCGRVSDCYSTGPVSGESAVGGLVGNNNGTVSQCYSASSASGSDSVGGLVGANGGGTVARCYSTGVVSGKDHVGGLVGMSKPFGKLAHPAVEAESFWDIQTSGQPTSAGGIGLTTNEMHAARTFLGWASYGPLWTLDEGRDYPHLAWEDMPGQIIPAPTYGGGTGRAEDPYLILTAQQFHLIGLASGHWDKHFKLMADIDLSDFDGQDGRPALEVIGPGREWYTPSGGAFSGTPFTGVFDGNGHSISHPTIRTDGCAGLFGRVEGEVMNLGVVDVNITSSGGPVGAVAAWNYGRLVCCYSTGAVSGQECVGGLIGWGHATWCYSEASATGISNVGGLVGSGGATQSYSTGVVSGASSVGGLIGSGGATACFWNIETSGQITSAGGTGLTNGQMHDLDTFRAAGWDFVGEADGPHDIWAGRAGSGYPILWWQLSPWASLPFPGGAGEPNDPYTISTPDNLSSIGHNPRLMKSHFKLVADLDMTGSRFYPIGDADCPYAGTFDGDDHTISHLTINGVGYLGLFGRLVSGAVVSNIDIADVNVTGTGENVGALVGNNGTLPNEGGVLVRCSSNGVVRGKDRVGGLIGTNQGAVTQCCSTGVVTGNDRVGGLVGVNSNGSVGQCYSAASANGNKYVGGLAGSNAGPVTQCYSTGPAIGRSYVGGLVGSNSGTLNECYSAGSVSGDEWVSGLVGWDFGPWVSDLVGYDPGASIIACFFDMQTSGQPKSGGVARKTTAEMQTAKTFLEAGWDFVGETDNGTEDIWWIDEGKDYPRLWWEQGDEASP